MPATPRTLSSADKSCNSVNDFRVETLDTIILVSRTTIISIENFYVLSYYFTVCNIVLFYYCTMQLFYKYLQYV